MGPEKLFLPATKNYQLTQLDFPSTITALWNSSWMGAGIVVNRAHLEGCGQEFSLPITVGLISTGRDAIADCGRADITSADMAYEYLNALEAFLSTAK